MLDDYKLSVNRTIVPRQGPGPINLFTHANVDIKYAIILYYGYS